MAIYFHRTSPFEENRIRIEDFIYYSIIKIQNNVEAAIRGVSKFSEEIDKFLDILEQMYQSPNSKDILGEKSLPISKGRYRIFYKVTVKPSNDFDITLLDIDDNREANLDRFPSHLLRTFESEED